MIDTYKISKALVQDERLSDDLPFGSQGGALIRHHFPLDAEYTIKVLLRRQEYDYIIGMGEPHQLDIRLDGVRLKRFTVGGEAKGMTTPENFAGNTQGDPEFEEYMHTADAHLEVRVPVKAGPHEVGVSFVSRFWEPEGVLQPPQTGFGRTTNEYYHGNPAVEIVMIGGPYGPARHSAERDGGRSPSRRKVFVCRPKDAAAEEPCARKILTTLAARAYRRPVTESDVQTLLGFYQTGPRRRRLRRRHPARDRAHPRRAELPLPHRTRAGRHRGRHRPIASAIWTSRRGSRSFSGAASPTTSCERRRFAARCSDPGMLEQQVQRMLRDPRSKALVDNFASRWLELSKIPGVVPDTELYPEFDENLRDAMEQETRLFVGSQVHDNRSVVELLTADYSFLNERLATHYGIPNIYGSHFRRVTFTDGRRGGLLGQASVLTVTSYPNRTSVTMRGRWLLANLLGAPPPPPPPDIPALKDAGVEGQPRSLRERMEMHRKNPACASCHQRMDPLGFALENFDALGKWRTVSDGAPIDPSAAFPDGTRFEGVAGLRDAARQPQGRLRPDAQRKAAGLRDRPRPRLSRHARGPQQSRAMPRRPTTPGPSIITGIVKSPPFSMAVASGDAGSQRKGPRMIISKKAIPRRTMLRGMGSMLALPLLDSMVPALSALQKTAARPINRFGVMYVPNGMIMKNYLPLTEGAGYELTPTLSALAPFREHVLVLSGLECIPTPGRPGGAHAKASTRFLTDVSPPMSETWLDAGISMDQILAQEMGKQTQVASLELAMESGETAGACDTGFACPYTNTISWKSPNTPLPTQNNPRVVFERLFGDSTSTDPKVRLARLRQQRSVLDSVSEEVARLQGVLPQSDRTKLTEYLDAIRGVEQRIQIAEAQRDQELPLVDHPAGIPAGWEDHMNLMLDLQVLAFQCDLTRVITFMVGHEHSGMTYPQIGVPDAHHPISHHQQEPEKVAKVAKINAYHVQMFARHAREAPGDARRRRHAAGSRDDDVRRGHRRQQQPLADRYPDDPCRRRRRASQGRTAHPVQEHAAGESAPDAAGSVRRAHGIRSGTAREESMRGSSRCKARRRRRSRCRSSRLQAEGRRDPVASGFSPIALHVVRL